MSTIRQEPTSIKTNNNDTEVGKRAKGVTKYETPRAVRVGTLSATEGKLASPNESPGFAGAS